jgi:hypothetical protein
MVCGFCVTLHAKRYQVHLVQIFLVIVDVVNGQYSSWLFVLACLAFPVVSLSYCFSEVTIPFRRVFFLAYATSPTEVLFSFDCVARGASVRFGVSFEYSFFDLLFFAARRAFASHVDVGFV